MARNTADSANPQDPQSAGDGWYGRWIDDIADDVADSMQGEEERQARIDDLHQRLDYLHRNLKQIKGRHRGRGPRVETQPDKAGDDARIQADVVARLTDDWYVDATDIDVRVANGEVTLSGLIDTRAAKRLAEDCADRVAGVRDVSNSLRIRQPG